MSNDMSARSGVDLAAGDALSALAGKMIEETWKANPLVQVHSHTKSFRGPRSFTLRNDDPSAHDLLFTLGSDGIGTKVGAHSAAGTYALSAHDLVAMLADDVARYGGMPLVMSSVLDVASTHDGAIYHQLMSGLVESARRNSIVVLNGETAELGTYAGGEEKAPFKFLWSGTMFGVYRQDLLDMVSGDDVCEGDLIVGFRENGFRSNGFSAVRKAFVQKFGEEWYLSRDAFLHQKLREAVAPSHCYTPLMSHLLGWPGRHTGLVRPYMRLKYIAHITGGGIPSKFGYGLLKPRGLSAEIDQPFPPPRIMENCKNWLGASSRECYDMWNGGYGMFVVVDPAVAPLLISTATNYRVHAQVVGRIREWQNPSLVIHSGFGIEPEHIEYSMAQQ